MFVLGAQRSGTSALTRVLSLCGCRLPAGLLGADTANPRGCWEPRKAIGINEEILYRNDSAWFDPSMRLLDADGFAAGRRAACIVKITSYLSTLSDAPVVVIKEPRITMLSDLWFEAAHRAGFDAVAVIAVRDPREVISSATASWGFSRELSSALWLKYNLLAERLTRGAPRVFIDYRNLLEDWRREVKRTSVALDIDLDGGDEEAVEEFLSPSLRRHRRSGPVTERFIADWIPAVYEELFAAARGESLDVSTLDRVFGSYRADETELLAALDEFRQHVASVRYKLARPAIAKTLIELQAMFHRRKGTWA
ncbi:sulfotransferase [Mycolicibacterium rhodesiae]|uniref:sulfotransferase family protein n=1 Tax=Mycolicibacterium rhodesiae TaxID=36814 RepID=UPI00059D2E81